MIDTRRPYYPYVGFTLVELLVAIGIIALLIGLTVMGVSKIRRAAWSANTRNTIMTIQNAIQTFHADNHKYPGAMSNSSFGAIPGIKVVTPFPVGYVNNGGANLTKLTGTENLVLDLYGGLYLDAANAITYDPARIGTGAGSLNSSNPKKSPAYLSDQKLLNESWQTANKDGHYKDDSGEADDSIVPELVDNFPQAMPILYLRASSGYELPNGTAPTVAANNIITKGNTSAGQYQLEQIQGYTGAFTGSWPSMTADTSATPAAGTHSIGEQKFIIKGAQYTNAGTPIATPAAPYHGLRYISPTLDSTMTKGDSKFQYPYDPYAYLQNPALSTSTTPVARQKDQFILISPGPDRIYGTEDDITSFGTVGE